MVALRSCCRVASEVLPVRRTVLRWDPRPAHGGHEMKTNLSDPSFQRKESGGCQTAYFETVNQVLQAHYHATAPAQRVPRTRPSRAGTGQARVVDAKMHC